MAKITKAIAEQVAKAVTAKLKQKIDDAEKEMSVAVTEIVLKRIPEEVMVAYKKAPAYISDTSYVYLNSNGYNSRKVVLTERLPYGRSYYIEGITNKEVAPLDKIEQKKEKLKDKYDRTYQEIESTLIGLGTYKRVQEQFPELYKYLPSAPGNTSLMIVPEKIRETVSCLISDDSKCIDKL